jgi:polar amino acid transport system substrate-binding protein
VKKSINVTVKRLISASIIAASAAGAFVATSANAESTLERLRASGTAKIAIANEPPYSAINGDGSVSGAAPDVAKAVLKELGINNVEAVIVDYGAMIPGLQAKRFDLVAAGLYIKPDRCNAILFSQPDVCDAEAFAIKADNPKGVSDYKSIATTGAIIGVCGGCQEEKYALEAGVKRENIVVFPDGSAGIKMLQAGRIDVLALAGLPVTDLLKKADDTSLDIIYPVGDAPQSCAGAGFRKADTEFRDAYDKALKKIKLDGSFAKIVDTYGFSTLTALSKTRADYCPGN